MITTFFPLPIARSVSSSNEVGNQDDQPQPKKSRGLFSHYKAVSAVSSSTQMQINPQQQLLDYISKINDEQFDAEAVPLSQLVGQYNAQTFV